MRDPIISIAVFTLLEVEMPVTLKTAGLTAAQMLDLQPFPAGPNRTYISFLQLYVSRRRDECLGVSCSDIEAWVYRLEYLQEEWSFNDGKKASDEPPAKKIKLGGA